MAYMAYPQYGDDIIPEEESSPPVMADDLYIPYGGVFTPKGTIRTLVIYAQFTNDREQTLDGWPVGDEVPIYAQTNANLKNLFFFQLSDFANHPNKRSISNYYKAMSNDSFTFLGDILRKNGNPYSIKIDSTRLAALPSNAGWGAINKIVLEQMQEEFPNFNWSSYDLHENKPNYKKDASLTGPDGIADYVIIIYRYNEKWEYQPVTHANMQ
jgi:hypothetical protein